jgi:hypothetical protein
LAKIIQGIVRTKSTTSRHAAEFILTVGNIDCSNNGLIGGRWKQNQQHGWAGKSRGAAQPDYSDLAWR